MNEPLRVAYFSVDSGLFGSERSLLAMAERLDRSKVFPRLVLSERGPFEEAARGRGLDVVVFPWLTGPFRMNLPSAAVAAWRFAAWLRRERVDVLELNRFYFGPLVVSLMAARLAGCKLIVRNRMHGARLPRLQKLALSRADAILTVTAGAVAPWKEPPQPAWWLDALGSRLKVCPSGRDLEAFGRITRERRIVRALGVPDGAPIIGLVAAIDPRKRQDLFLAAAKMILEQVPDAWFLVVGGVYTGAGPRRSEYAESLLGSITGTPLAKRVVFTGFRDDAPALMKNFDVSLMTSDREAFGGVIIEAMALGVPVVAAGVDGVPEVVENGVNGVLIPRQEARLYAEAVVRLLADAEERKRIVEAAARSASKYDVRGIALEMEQLYETLSAPRVPTPRAGTIATTTP